MKKLVSLFGTDSEVEIEHDAAASADVQLVSIGNNEAVLKIGERRVTVPFIVDGERVEFQYDGEVYVASVTAPGSRAKKRQGVHSMSAPMPGMVLKVLTTAGAEVTKGTPLLVLEAMKMEHQIVAPYDGTVKSVKCREGELVQPGVDLIEVTPKLDEQPGEGTTK